MLDVEIQNFQSIEHIKLRIDGFTALVGRSNLGKSAIVRAVKAALTGAPEENFVRHGPLCERRLKNQKACKCYCSVHLKADGFDLLWEKGGDKNEYLFNGTSHTAVGRGTPEFLQAYFGPVKVGNEKILLQVADQFRSEGGGPIFLLDQPGSVAADVLSDVAQLDQINVASRMVEKDRKDASAQRKVRERDIFDLRARHARYDTLDTVVERVRDVERDQRSLDYKRRCIEQLFCFIQETDTLLRQMRTLKEVTILPFPEIKLVQEKDQHVSKLGNYIVSITNRLGVVSRLQGIGKIEVPSIEILGEMSSSFNHLDGWLNRLRASKDFFAKSKAAEGVPVPTLDPVQALSQKVLRFGEWRRKYAAVSERVSSLEQFVAQIQKEYEKIQAEIDILGVCPTCEQPLNFAHGHAAE